MAAGTKDGGMSLVGIDCAMGRLFYQGALL
jgi:hypothetical protein